MIFPKNTQKSRLRSGSGCWCDELKLAEGNPQISTGQGLACHWGFDVGCGGCAERGQHKYPPPLPDLRKIEFKEGAGLTAQRVEMLFCASAL